MITAVQKVKKSNKIGVPGRAGTEAPVWGRTVLGQEEMTPGTFRGHATCCRRASGWGGVGGPGFVGSEFLQLWVKKTKCQVQSCQENNAKFRAWVRAWAWVRVWAWVRAWVRVWMWMRVWMWVRAWERVWAWVWGLEPAFHSLWCPFHGV